VLGNDGVGEVAALGTGVEGVPTGDRVVINPALDWGNDPRPQGPRFRILGLPDNGTFAEFVKVPAANVSRGRRICPTRARPRSPSAG
jgi:zinc-binding alcohol dehydrogenase/oxidoreductase